MALPRAGRASQGATFLASGESRTLRPPKDNSHAADADVSRNPRPAVIFLAFANDREDRARYLRNLPKEQRRIRDAIAPAVEAGHCEVVERNNATVDDVFDVLQDPRYRDRVAVFHYGGHAGPAELVLETPTGGTELAHAGGLAAFLGEQRGLALVFLNGCSSAGQVQALLDAGVPAVVATSQAIDDAVATELAARFYRSLASGMPLRTAYAEAQAAVRTRWGSESKSTYRSTVAEAVGEERWPWDVYVRPGAEEHASKWSLALAARDHLYGLPSPPAMELPASPFKHLDWFTREDAAVFFGRGRAIRDLYETLTAIDAPPIVLLFGETGAGKSSLLAAGLAPRLEATRDVIYTRRDGSLGLGGTLARALGAAESTSDDVASDLGDAWRQREAAAGKPLVVILDQAEEAWTRPLPGGQEAQEVVAALRSIFGARDRPQGKLLLGFRKEWLAEVLRVLDAERLPRDRVELRHLDREGIVEVVEGPASTERLRRRYKLEIEPGLAEEIAADLAIDARSSVAPTLQILLSKMWAEASQGTDAPRFTIELYREMKRKGILLDDFLEQQLAELATWRRDTVSSGLALDLLAHHTTPLGTAETRQAVEVVARYGGRPDVVALLGQCKDLYLLVGTVHVQEGELAPVGNDPADLGTTRLAHDTLAPLVRRRFEASMLPGQRATRLLAQRAVDWSDGKQGTPFDEVDLSFVEAGANGMRAWNADEARLVEASRAERSRRALARRALRIGMAVAAVVVATVAAVAWWQRSVAVEATEKAQDTARVVVAREWMDRDPTRGALVLLEVAKPEEIGHAQSGLREALESGLSSTILRGLPDGGYGIAFDPDGTRVVSLSADNTVWISPIDGRREPIVLRGHNGRVLSAAFSPDGTRVVTTSADGTARVWAADGAGEPVVLRGDESEVTSAAFSPDGARLVTVDDGNNARVWAADGSGEPVILSGHGDALNVAVWSPDGSRIATASGDATARVWQADGSGEPVVLRGHEGPVRGVSFSRDGQRVATAGDDGTARVWAADGSGEPVILRHHGVVLDARFSLDSKRIVTRSDDKTAHVWRADGLGEPVVLRGHVEDIFSAAFTPDGQRIITASGRTVRVWQPDGLGEPLVLRGHDGLLTSFALSRDGRRVVSAADDATLRVWPLEGFADPVVLRGHQWAVNSAAFSRDGKRVLTASDDGTARIWAADGSGEAIVLRGHEGEVTRAAFSPDGKRVVTASRSVARVWAADGSGTPTVLQGHSKWLWDVAFSPAGDRVLTVSLDETARVWTVDGSREPVVLRGHEESVGDGAFSPDGERVVTGSTDGTARVWPADGVAEPMVLRGHEGPVESVAFSPDGRRIITASADKTARMWAADGSGKPVVLRGHTDAVESAVFSPNGRRVVTASADWTARVWAADGSGEPVVLRGHRKPVRSAAFSPDGRRIVTASADGTVRLWGADGSGQLVVLRGQGDMRDAAFSPDGRRIVAAGSDGTARVWAIDETLLQAMMRRATTACLDHEFRIGNLGEAPQKAAATYDRCERCVSKWHPRFDLRSILGDPKEGVGRVAAVHGSLTLFAMPGFRIRQW